MATRTDFDWVNRPQWEAALDRFLRDLGLDLASNAEALGEYIKDRAQGYCPVDTGRLQAGVEVDTESHSTGIRVELRDDVPYAPYVEYGTRRNRAQPFMRPAMADGEAAYLKYMAR